MNITVLGIWHLGSVTAACCARHFPVVGLDFDETNVANLNTGQGPVAEPGLAEIISSGLATGRLTFTSCPEKACSSADVLWLAYDTPVNDDDESDVDFVLDNLRKAVPHLRDGALVLMSSQLPVGTCGRLETEFPQFHFACSPENLRLGKALNAFENPDRVVIGIRNDKKKEQLRSLFSPFTQNILFMETESAEMVKHALNSFLALSISYINEIARICEMTGADAGEVSAGLKSDIRIGTKARLGPGGPFAGGTLARDVVTLTKIAQANGEQLTIIPAIKQSNDRHQNWAIGKLRSHLGSLEGKTIAVLGLTYTPNTDTLRRSAAVELCAQLVAENAMVQPFDPAVKALPLGLASLKLASDLEAALAGADAAVVCTEWPQFLEADWTKIIPQMRSPLFVDANRFLKKELSVIPNVELVSVGRIGT